MLDSSKSRIGIVVIGRNEGERLRRCLESAKSVPCRIVYVDSASTDGSFALAQSMGVESLALDMSKPFCAARARNEGYSRLLELDNQLTYVQFIDADCELIGDWLRHASEALDNQPDVAAVAGWLRERSPENSIYNRLAELEWNASGPGPVDAVGGIFLIRRVAFDSVGGFDPTIPAGEEPELCQRLSQKGWRLLRLDCEMARHDLAMTRFGQWWRRMMRSGYGSMDVAWRFGVTRFSDNTRRVVRWSVWLLITIVTALIALSTQSIELGVGTAALVAIWPLRLIRITLRALKNGWPWGIAFPYALLMAICFLPEGLGQLNYLIDRLRNRSIRLVEYKGSPGAGH